MLDSALATWPEAASHAERRPLAILAFGAQEQHGPHLPLSTDTIIAAELARRLAEALDAVLLPPIPYGETWTTSGFAGTVSIGFDTVRSLLLDIGRSLQAHDFEALVVVNGHFGNRAPLEQAARSLSGGTSLRVLLLDYPDLEKLAQEICASSPAAPAFYHADEVETSLVLACLPGAVHMERAVREYPIFPVTFGAEPLRLDSFCASGVFGDPLPATAAKGERLFAGLTQACLAMIEAFLYPRQTP